MINVKEVGDSSFPPEGVAVFRRALSRCRARVKKDHSELVTWTTDVAEDEDIFSALLELVCWYRIVPKDLLGFLQGQRLVRISSRELRARLREGGKRWKAVERMAAKARKETEPFLAELAGRAVEVERTARLLSKSLMRPVRHRPFEEEIAACKQDIVGFLKRKNVREVNRYGWVLLRAIFGDRWKAGKGKDQVGTFRRMKRPFGGRIKTRQDAQIVMEGAKLEWFKMLQETEK
jgi:hypothetical protein